MNPLSSVKQAASGIGAQSVSGSQKVLQSSGGRAKSFSQVLTKSLERHVSNEAAITANSRQNGHEIVSTGIRLRDTLKTVFKESEEVSRIFNELNQGKRLSNSELLEIQGRLLNFNLDLTTLSKVVEQTVNAVKTVIQTQV